MNGNYSLPVNIGNPDEYTMLEFAKAIIEQTGSTSKIIFKPLPKDDPMRRKPDITRAKTEIGWAPVVTVKEGLAKSIPYFANELQESKLDTSDSGHVRKTGPYAHMDQYIMNSQADP
jgi:nucleoside-diphosphate-sugar epimerase